MAKLSKPPHPLYSPEGKIKTTINLSIPTHEAIKALADRERRTFSAQSEIVMETGLAIMKASK